MRNFKIDMLQFIKCSTDENILEVHHLATSIWNEHYLSIIGQNQIDYMLNKNQSIEAIQSQIEKEIVYYLVKQDDQNCAYFAYQFLPDHVFLSKLYVSNHHRGNGIASKCLDFIKTIAQDQQLNHIRLAVHKQNRIALGFYHKVGFIIVQDIIQDIGGGFVMDDYLLCLEIK